MDTTRLFIGDDVLPSLLFAGAAIGIYSMLRKWQISVSNVADPSVCQKIWNDNLVVPYFQATTNQEFDALLAKVKTRNTLGYLQMFDNAPWCDPSRAPSAISQTKDPNLANWNLFNVVSPTCLNPCVGGSTDPCNDEYATTFDAGDQPGGWTKCNLFQDASINSSTVAGCRCKGTPSYGRPTGFPNPTDANDNGYVCAATQVTITPKGYTAYTGPDGLPGIGACGLRQDLAQALVQSAFPSTSVTTDFPSDLFPDDSMTPPVSNGKQLHSPSSVDGKGGHAVARTLIQKKGTVFQNEIGVSQPFTNQVTTAMYSYDSTKPNNTGDRKTWQINPDVFQTWPIIDHFLPWTFPAVKNQPSKMTPADYASMYNFDVNDVDQEPVLAKGPYQMQDGTENGLTWRDSSVPQPVNFTDPQNGLVKTPYLTAQPCTPGANDNVGLDTQKFNGCGIFGITGNTLIPTINQVNLMAGTKYQYLFDSVTEANPVTAMNKNAVWEGPQSAISNQPTPQYGFLSSGAQLYQESAL